MDTFIIIIGILFGVGLLSALVVSFTTFDQLISLEYLCHKEQWEADGKPRGFLWIPPVFSRSQNASWFNAWKSQYKSSWAHQKLSLIWLFSTPQWVRDDEIAKKLLKRLHTLVLIWNGGLLLGFISLFLFRN